MALATTGTFKKNAFKGDCQVCGKKARKGTDCWDNQTNKDKCPSFYKSPNQRNNGGGTNTSTVCGYCDKKGHKEQSPFRKKHDQGNINLELVMLIPADFLKCKVMGSTGTNDEKIDQDCFDSVPGTMQVLSNKEDTKNSQKLGTDKLMSNMFIADSAATSHMKFSLNGMVDLIPWKIKVKFGNRNESGSMMKGTYKHMVVQKDGSQDQTILSDVLIIPELWIDLLSLMKVLKNANVILGSQGTLISLIIGKR
jgi:hypothetical protein